MELVLKRYKRTEVSTIGNLFVDGQPECSILEDIDRGLKSDMTLGTINSIKVHGKTAIPTGRYEIAITFSNKFKKYLPLLLNVPGFDGVRVHSGNVANDSDGCLLPGTVPTENAVLNSRVAFTALFTKIRSAIKKEKVFITIE